MNRQSPPPNVWLGRLAKLTAAATFLLIIAGGMVTSTESGLAVPDWPLSYGQLFPPMVGGVFYEHGHRMVASFVGLLTIALAVWLWRRDPRRWVRNLGWGALLAVVVQGVLGGITVLYLLPTPVSVFHALLAQTFFCWTVSLALFTSYEWQVERTRQVSSEKPSLRWLCVATTAVIYLQLFLGALMRHTGSGLAIPDFPLAFGQLVPEFSDGKIAIHFAHRVGALLVTAFILWTAIRVVARYREDLRFLVPAIILVSLLSLQIALGAATVWSKKDVFPTTAHVATGALILAAHWVLTLRAFRFTSSAVEGANLGIAASRAATELPI